MAVKIQFASISVGPHAFCAVGPSGHPELFKRKDCTLKLERFIEPLKLTEVLQSFHDLQAAKKSEFPNRATTWGDVISFLARIKSTKPTLIPPTEAVAMWGLSIEFATQQEN